MDQPLTGPGATAAGRPRRSRPTLQDIADGAGVSPGLVSLVLRGRAGPSAATAQRVVEVADRLGYRANRAASRLASRRTRLFGVTMTPGNPYQAELVEELQSRAHARGYDVLLAAVTRSQDEQRSIETLVDSRCEALILLGPKLSEELLERSTGGVPTVSIGRPLALPDVDVVRSADHEGVDMLVGHLAGLGHRRIAHVDGGDLPLPAERVRAYRQAMRRRRLPALVVPGGETWPAGARAGAVLLEQHRDVTAVLAYNDQTAIGLMDHLRRDGIAVPQDVSVTGFDNDRLAGLVQLGLTTVDPAKIDQARRALDLAVRRAEGFVGERVVQTAPAMLIVRTSTGAPHAGGRRPTRGSATTSS